MLKILIVFGICLLLLGCSSSYVDCTYECHHIKANEFCKEHYGDTLYQNRCIDGTYYTEEIYLGPCMKLCSGSDD